MAGRVVVTVLPSGGVKDRAAGVWSAGLTVSANKRGGSELPRLSTLWTLSACVPTLKVNVDATTLEPVAPSTS